MLLRLLRLHYTVGIVLLLQCWCSRNDRKVWLQKLTSAFSCRKFFQTFKVQSWSRKKVVLNERVGSVNQHLFKKFHISSIYKSLAFIPKNDFFDADYFVVKKWPTIAKSIIFRKCLNLSNIFTHVPNTLKKWYY